jgi:hypothetical protein
MQELGQIQQSTNAFGAHDMTLSRCFLLVLIVLPQDTACCSLHTSIAPRKCVGQLERLVARSDEANAIADRTSSNEAFITSLPFVGDTLNKNFQIDRRLSSICHLRASFDYFDTIASVDKEPVQRDHQTKTKVRASPSTPASWARGRRQGRILSSFVYKRLRQASSEHIQDIAENMFESSVDVIDGPVYKLAKEACKAAIAVDRSALQVFSSSGHRSSFITGNSKHMAQAMWATALDLHNALLAPLKSLLLHLGNIGAVPNPVPILTFTFFAFLHAVSSTWFYILYYVQHLH